MNIAALLEMVIVIWPEWVSRLLFESPPTLRRGVNGFCTSKEHKSFSGVKVLRPLRQAQGGLNQKTATAMFIQLRSGYSGFQSRIVRSRE